MITNYYTLRALVREWTPDLVGCVVGDAFSQVRDELTLALASPERSWMLRLSVRAPFRYLFRSEGYSRKRRNVATLFEAAFGQTVTACRLAERDRMLYLDLEGGGAIQVMLFGPRANVFRVDAGGTILEAFQRDAELAGTPAPRPRPAPAVETLAAFQRRWQPARGSTMRALAAALPLFDRALVAEVMHRAGVTTSDPAAVTEAERIALFEAARTVRAELLHPAPRLYERGDQVEAFALLPLAAYAGYDEERFATVDAAVRVFVRRAMGQQRFRALRDPVRAALARAAEHDRRTADRMLEELAAESRADRYERWGHLLMAAPGQVPAGADRVTLPDLFAGGEPVTIPLDPSLTAIDNARRYYDKARRTRQARAHAEERLLKTAQRAREAEALLAALEAQTTVRDLERFLKQEAERLAPFIGQRADVEHGVPFRRFDLGSGYEVWVGRNAKQNDALTFRHARKYDLWMHARGVAGSHVVLRVPHRQARPEPRIKEQAAAIAAYYSKARGSDLVPVMVTERKYVRKPKGAAPGAVTVEREEVLLVEPKRPE